MIFWIIAVMVLEFGLGFFLGRREERKKTKYIIAELEKITELMERKIKNDKFYNE